MGRIAINDADKYSSQRSGTDFFSLKDDRDSAVVRFMYDDADDVGMDVVHEVEVDGKKRFVNCIRKYDEPADACPLCKAGNKQVVKMFVPLYVESEKEAGERTGKPVGKVKIWQRGRTFPTQLSSLMDRCESPMCRTMVEIERNGRKGDQGTRYTMYPGKSDETALSDLPEVPDLLGGLIMDKSYAELDNFVKTGKFNGSGADVAPRRRPQVEY